MMTRRSRLSRLLPLHFRRKRDLFHNFNSESFEPRHPAMRMVGKHSNPSQIQVGENLRANARFTPHLALFAGGTLRAVAVECQYVAVGHSFHGESFGSLVQINESATPLSRNRAHGTFQNGVAGAPCGTENISHQAVRMHAD